MSIRCVKDVTSSTEEIEYKPFTIDKILVTDDKLNIFYFTYYDYAEFLLELYDSSGKRVHQKSIRIKEGSNFYQIDISGLSKGVYIFKLNSHYRTESKSIMIK